MGILGGVYFSACCVCFLLHGCGVLGVGGEGGVLVHLEGFEFYSIHAGSLDVLGPPTEA